MTQIFIISGTSWTVPGHWNSVNNSIETIGGGGGGQTANASYAGSGGGGGAYSKITNLSLIPNSSVTVSVGAGSTAGNGGGDTWFNGASLAASSVGAKGGGAGANGAGGAGGAAASGVGTTGIRAEMAAPITALLMAVRQGAVRRGLTEMVRLVAGQPP